MFADVSRITPDYSVLSYHCKMILFSEKSGEIKTTSPEIGCTAAVLGWGGRI